MGQTNYLNILKTRFEKPFDPKWQATEGAWQSISKLSPGHQLSLIDSLANSKIAAKYPTKVMMLKARFSRAHMVSIDGKDWIYWGNEAIKNAVAANNNYLLEDACALLGDGYLSITRKDTALFYLLKALEIGDKLGYEPAVMARRKVAASIALYQTQNYRECLDFCLAAIPFAGDFDLISRITMFNNIGLSYLRTGKPDSALGFFMQAVRTAQEGNNGVWVGIASGNIGDALHESGRTAEAIPYWQTDVDSCLAFNELPNAGLSLAYLAQEEFRQGKKREALQKLGWANRVNSLDPVNLVRILAIQARAYRLMALHDSSDYFWARHYALADSLKSNIEKGNYNTVQLRLQYERFAQNLQLLNKEKIALENRRNLLFVAILSLIVIGGLVYNRQRLRLKLEMQSHAIAEAEIKHARQQLDSFTEILIEKNEQIEQLTASLQQMETANHDELIQRTLLTDYDWNRFRELFEKCYPGFFERLKTHGTGITASEMRLAALIKLNLDNKQMAGMQGISVSTIRGNKTRLRQKILLPAEAELDDFIKAL